MIEPIQLVNMAISLNWARRFARQPNYFLPEVGVRQTMRVRAARVRF
jgi:hypothetical protein